MQPSFPNGKDKDEHVLLIRIVAGQCRQKAEQVKQDEDEKEKGKDWEVSISISKREAYF